MSSSFNPITLNFDGTGHNPRIIKHNTWEVNFTWTDSADVAVDLSYYSALMQIKKNSQSSPIVSLSTTNGSITLTSQGNIKLNISDDITSTLIPGKYIYSLVLSDTSSIDTNGEGMNVFTLISGSIVVEDSITWEV